jgi:hypothetical protein
LFNHPLAQLKHHQTLHVAKRFHVGQQIEQFFRGGPLRRDA